MENGELRMEDGEWRIEDGELRIGLCGKNSKLGQEIYLSN